VAISAQDVRVLREKTGTGIMDCKKALTDTNGDLENAIKFLREKGLADSKKRSGREAREGIITIVYSGGRDTASMVEVNCETDFVSRTDQYQDFVRNITQIILDKGAEDAKNLPEDVNNMVKEAIATFGENITVRKVARFNKIDMNRSVFHSYIHLGGKVGVIVEFLLDNGGSIDNEHFQQFAKNTALQIASMGPFGVLRDDFPKEVVDEQREIFIKQAKESGKPEKIIEKIITGKMAKFFAETSLLEQKYVKNNDITVGQYLKETEKTIDGKIEIKRFVRFKLGEE